LHERARGQGLSDARSKLEHLGGSIVYDYRDGPRECYRLTLLGILLTADGPGVERLLVRHAAGESMTAAETARMKHVLEAAEWLRDPAVLAGGDVATLVATRALDSYDPVKPIDGVA
jgi:hypothetical protein